MEVKEALSLLDRAVSQLALNRVQHAELARAVQIIEKALGIKESDDEVKKKK